MDGQQVQSTRKKIRLQLSIPPKQNAQVDARGVRRQNAQVPWRGRVPQEIVADGEGGDEGTTELQTGEEPTAHPLQQDQPES